MGAARLAVWLFLLSLGRQTEESGQPPSNRNEPEFLSPPSSHHPG